MSGDVAVEYLQGHLHKERTDGVGRTVHRCSETDVEWIEERSQTGYGSDVTVLRRVPD
ncbi:MAG: hypothetical protein ACLFRD_07120 [Nitriliruptoraceae bacterium]